MGNNIEQAKLKAPNVEDEKSETSPQEATPRPAHKGTGHLKLAFEELSDESFIRLKQLLDNLLVPFSPATLWRKVDSGDFPRPVKVSTQISAWRVRQIRFWSEDPSNYKQRAEQAQ